MQLLLIIGYSVIFISIIWKWKWFKDDKIKRYFFISIFILKIVSAIFAGALYKEQYDGGDTYTFFYDAQILTSSYFHNKSDFFSMIAGTMDDMQFMNKYGVMQSWSNMDVVYNDSKTMIRLHALLNLITLGYYNVNAIFFAFLAMLGLMGIYKVTRLLTDQHPYLLLVAVFFPPGIMFWCSMASKESLLIFAMGMFLYHCIRLLTISKSVGNMVGMCLAGFLFIHIKAYLLVLITPCLIAFTWVHVTNQKFSLLKYSLTYLVFIVLFFNIKYMIPGIDPVEILVMKRMNFEAFAIATPKDFGSYIELPEFSSDWGDIITVAPIAAFSVFARPYLWESSSVLTFCAALENILILLFLAAGFKYIKWDRMALNKNLLLFCGFFVITVFVLIGLTSPVMGAIVRYKAPMLPFLCLIPLVISAKLHGKKI